jgi:hypothetical protein
MSHWSSEEVINAQLRDLTSAARKVRADLDELIRAERGESGSRYPHRLSAGIAAAHEVRDGKQG